MLQRIVRERQETTRKPKEEKYPQKELKRVVHVDRII